VVTYADSSFIVSLLVEDGNSASAKRFVLRNLDAIIITSFSKCEVQHAVRAMAFKKQMTPDEMYRSLLRFERDQDEDFFRLEPLTVETLFLEADQLSARHTLDTGVRFLDMLHVASAQLLKADRFLTFDLRQRTLAAAVGFNVRI